MANAKQCDICGKFYAAHKLSKKLGHYDMRDTGVIALYDPDPNAEYPRDLDGCQEELESCPDCMRKVKTFIAEMKGD